MSRENQLLWSVYWIVLITKTISCSANWKFWMQLNVLIEHKCFGLICVYRFNKKIIATVTWIQFPLIESIELTASFKIINAWCHWAVFVSSIQSKLNKKIIFNVAALINRDGNMDTSLYSFLKEKIIHIFIFISHEYNFFFILIIIE